MLSVKGQIEMERLELLLKYREELAKEFIKVIHPLDELDNAIARARLQEAAEAAAENKRVAELVTLRQKEYVAAGAVDTALEAVFTKYRELEAVHSEIAAQQASPIHVRPEVILALQNKETRRMQRLCTLDKERRRREYPKFEIQELEALIERERARVAEVKKVYGQFYFPTQSEREALENGLNSMKFQLDALRGKKPRAKAEPALTLAEMDARDEAEARAQDEARAVVATLQS
jgi:hypothetical protein